MRAIIFGGALVVACADPAATPLPAAPTANEAEPKESISLAPKPSHAAEDVRQHAEIERNEHAEECQSTYRARFIDLQKSMAN